MSDVLKKVQSGDKLRIPAAAYNAFVDTAMDHKLLISVSPGGYLQRVG